jgi:hypothetical protein
MNFSDVFKDSFTYPLKDLKKFFILFLLFLGSFIIIPGIAALGYSLRIIEHTLDGKKGLPDFNDFGQLFGKGLELIGVNIIYKVPVFVVMISMLLIGKNPLLVASSITSLNYLTILLLVIGFLVSIFYMIGLANMVHEKSFNSAFDFRRILELIKKIGWKKYLTYIVLYTIIVELINNAPILLKALTSHVNILGLIGYFIISFIFSTYILAFGSRFKGLIYPLEKSEVENDGPLMGD